MPPDAPVVIALCSDQDEPRVRWRSMVKLWETGLDADDLQSVVTNLDRDTGLLRLMENQRIEHEGGIGNLANRINSTGAGS